MTMNVKWFIGKKKKGKMLSEQAKAGVLIAILGVGVMLIPLYLVLSGNFTDPTIMFAIIIIGFAIFIAGIGITYLRTIMWSNKNSMKIGNKLAKKADKFNKKRGW